MPFSLPTSLDLVLLNIQQRLVLATGLHFEVVRLRDPDKRDMPQEQGDVILYVWPDSEMGSLYAGAGRLDTRNEVVFGVEVASRLQLDVRDDAQAWLTDPNLGHIRYRHMVSSALTGWACPTCPECWLLDAPLAPHRLSRPERVAKTPGWGYSRVGFQGRYILGLSPVLAIETGGAP